MSLVPVWLARAVDGALVLERQPGLAPYLRRFKPDDTLEVVIQRRRRHRTTKQNNYYRGVVLHVLSEWNGDTPDGWHEYLGWQFLRDESGQVPRRRSTTELTTVEFWDYIDRIQRWAADSHGVVIPDPGTVDVSQGMRD